MGGLGEEGSRWKAGCVRIIWHPGASLQRVRWEETPDAALQR